MSEGGASTTDERDLPPDAVERIRASNDAWHRRDVEGVLAPYADDIEWDTTEAYLDGRVYRGIPALRAYFAALESLGAVRLARLWAPTGGEDRS